MAGIEIKTHLLHMAAEGYGTSAVSCTLVVRRNTSTAVLQKRSRLQIAQYNCK